ncbi:MAG: hypothetical protein A3H35_04550 [Betaproteobacteria bacterium RIFCSPLOWO2_02_FULL_62_17]|nr:MAG: hypothetical protein A3H35_04550 [Betaproteobacteria bacterium RIFCSPLOWO2_02_FULL_62_17]
MRITSQFTIVLLAALAGASAAQAQTFPSKPVRIIIASAPGVTTDILGRGMLEPLSRALGQTVIVENRVGADGIIGTEACVRAAPDGHSLCGTASNVIVWNTVLRKKLPYDVLNDLTPVMLAGFFDSALVVHPAVPATNVQQLFEHAKANANKVNWAHFGVNSTGYMYMRWLNVNKGTAFYPVPYKTPPQNVAAMVSGEGHAAVTSLNTAGPHVKAGRLRALAVTSSSRISDLPNVPTFEEEGIKLPLRTWFGYHYQTAVPREIVLRMNSEIRKVFDIPAFKTSVLDGIGLTATPGSPEDLDVFQRAQIKAVSELVAGIGIKPE